MTRDIETALLHGHPLAWEEDALQEELIQAHPQWRILRTQRGWEAHHRTEQPDPRTARVGIKTHLVAGCGEELSNALSVQRALRGDGAEPER